MTASSQTPIYELLSTKSSLECAWCTKRFELKRQANRRSRYCSAACRLKAHRSAASPGAGETIIPAAEPQDDRFTQPSAPQTAADGAVISQARATFRLSEGCVNSDWKPFLPPAHERLP